MRLGISSDMMAYRFLPIGSGSLTTFAAMRRASSESQSLGGNGIARITMAVDVTEALAVRVHDFEAAV